MKILFNEIAPKKNIFCATGIGVTCFFNIVAPEGGVGHKIFDHQIGGVTKILPYFRKFMTPLFQRKWWPPKIMHIFNIIIGLKIIK